MKQALKIFGLLLISLSLTLTSCGDDDKDNPTPSDGRHDSALVGRWLMINADDGEYIRYEFYEDGQLIVFVKDEYGSDTGVLEWETQDGKLILSSWCDEHQMYEKEIFRYSVRNDILTIIGVEDGWTELFRKI